MSKKSEKGKGSEIDEHDLPTVPVPYAPAIPDMSTMPATPQQPITLGPFQQGSAYPAPPNAPKFDVYPYRPPLAPQPQFAPQQPTQTSTPPQPVQQKRGKQSAPPFYLNFIPIGIGLCFVCIQMLLLTRFVLRLLEIAEGPAWVNTVYALCDIVLLPFQALLPPLQLPEILNARVEPYTLLAVLIYGILSRIIVHLLKILLRVPQRRAAQNAGRMDGANPSQTRPVHPGY